MSRCTAPVAAYFYASNKTNEEGMAVFGNFFTLW